MTDATLDGRLELGQTITFAQAAVGASLIAFGGLNWALDGAAAPTAAVEPAAAGDGPGRRARARRPRRPPGCPPGRSGSATSPSPTRAAAAPPVLDGFDLTIPAGSSLAIVGPERRRQDHAGQAPVPALRPAGRRHRGRRRRPARARPRRLARAGHRGVPGLHPLRAAAARQRGARRAPTTPRCSAALAEAGGAGLADLDTPLAKGYPGGTDLSGGQWQRVALARALCAVRLGAGVVLLDEPTAQLDVRGEAEIFERVLAATRHCTTILVSHRFSTVRHADRICVLEHGRVVELGSHDELMAPAGATARCSTSRPSASPARRGRGGGGLRCPRLSAAPTAPTTTCRRRSRRCGACASSATARADAHGRSRSCSALLAALPDALLALLARPARRRRHRRRLRARPDRRRRPGRCRRWPPGSCARCRPACSAASATRSPSPSSPTWPSCRRRSSPSPTRSGPSSSTGCRCCATRCSCSTTCTCRCSPPPGWLLRLVITIVLLAYVDPALLLLGVFAIPTVITSTLATRRRAARPRRRARRPSGSPRTCSPPPPPRRRPRRCGSPASARGWWSSAGRAGRPGTARSPATRAGLGGVAQPGVGGVRPRLRRRHRLRGVGASTRPPATCCSCVAAGSRLSAYIGATVGEIGFLRGIWMDGSQRLAWLEDYAAALDRRRPTCRCPIGSPTASASRT